MKPDQCPHGAFLTALSDKPVSLPIFNLLRANSANPNKSHPKTNRLLFHVAVKNANAEFVKLLVEYGSNIYEAPLIPTRKGTLPLMLSAAQT
ncbi:hypothetical protein N7453_011446 [Penicillium expansum]|nr:hypothetical protein N7453_011446 [Penicillium expansum]